MTMQPPAGEREWIATIVANLSDDTVKLVYADWLKERGDDRSHFLRAFVATARSVNRVDFFECEVELE